MSNYDDPLMKQIQSFAFTITPPSSHSTNYYPDYCRLYLSNIVLTSQMKDIIRETKQLQDRIYKFQERNYEYEESEEAERNKRHRRTAGEVSRFHKCHIIGCGKSYGSEGSLNQHIKIKHPQGGESVKEQESEQSEIRQNENRGNRWGGQNENQNMNHGQVQREVQLEKKLSVKVEVEEHRDKENGGERRGQRARVKKEWGY